MDIENRLVLTKGEGVGGRMEWDVTIIYRMDKQEGPTV